MSIEWISSEYSLIVDEIEVGSLVYVGDTPRKGSSREVHFNSCIDVSLPIGTKKLKFSKLDTGQFLKYSELTPNERATYLHWLASTRQQRGGRADFVRLYVSGLEYRFFKDDSDLEEKREIYEEVKRLSFCYGNNIYLRWSFDGFLRTAKAMIFPSNYTPTFQDYYADTSRSAAIAIGRDIASGLPVTAERSLAWWRWDPYSSLDRTYYACKEEFLLLYKNLFEAKYPNGFVVQQTKGNIVNRYSGHFGKFTVDIVPKEKGNPIPDISKLQEPVNIFQSFVDDATEALKKLGVYRYKPPIRCNILDEHSLIPASIRHNFTSDRILNLKKWLKGKGPNSHFTIKRLCQKLYCKAPNTVTPIIYRQICNSLAKIGFGLTPDPRLMSPTPNLNEKLLVFPIIPAEDFTTGIGDNLLAGIVELSVGVSIANIFGEKTPAKTRALEQIIEKQKIREDTEKTALTAHLDWFFKKPPEKATLKKFLKTSDESQNRNIRQTVINMARATGATNTKVIAYVEEVYKLLGLDSVAAYSDLHAGEIVEQLKTAKEIENVKTRKVKVTESRRTRKVRLNEKKVKTLSKETLEVSKLLSKIFNEEALRNPKPSMTICCASKSTRAKSKVKQNNPSSTQIVFRGLETTHIPLTLELLSKVHWTDKQVAKLASKHSLMWQGSLEVINEWAFETLGSELIEEYNGYQLNADAVEKLSKQVKELS